MRTTSFFVRLVSSLTITVMLGTLSSGCDRRKSAPPEPEPTDLPLLDPDEGPKRDLPKRCKALPGGQIMTLRARDGKANSPVEVGGATAVSQGFVVGGLRAGDESRAFVAWTDGRGQTRTVELGRVHGAVDAPIVTADGADVFALVVDNDAGHTRLRLARVSAIASQPQVTWGPEASARRGETSYFGLAALPSFEESTPASGLLVWDDFEKSTSRSRIVGLPFSPQTMKATGAEAVLSPPDDDAVWPQLVNRGNGFLLAWLSYREMAEDQEPGLDEPLVKEPPRVLRVVALDGQGRAQGEPLDVTPPAAHVLAYEISSQGDGSLLVASRLARGGQAIDSIDLRVVGTDGSVSVSTLTHERLGPGAPLALGSKGPGKGWILARGDEQELLFGFVDGPQTVRDFEEEPDLEGKIPLARAAGDLFAMEPRGLDLRLSVYRCPD